jgi:phosphate starvation-inducible PhoH-like protein
MSINPESLSKELQSPAQSCDFTFDTEDNRRLADICGQYNEHLRHIEESLGVEINNRGNRFQVVGESTPARKATSVLRELYAETVNGPITPARVHMVIQQISAEEAQPKSDATPSRPREKPQEEEILVGGRRGSVKVRNPNQKRYLVNIRQYDVNFGIGPAGTGKTYLAVACAVEALDQERVRRIVLVRPAVEAGERLGFLPGDLAQKIDPYLRPLYDALYEMLGFEKVAKLMERNVIEVAPLAYMRGRTLNDSFVILDEAQNTTVEQMKMFLTRIGFGSAAIVTGDMTQVDLPRGKMSGLRHATEVLKGTKGIGFTFFNAGDVVRHPLVQRIVTAYEAFENQTNETEQDGD